MKTNTMTTMPIINTKINANTFRHICHNGFVKRVNFKNTKYKHQLTLDGAEK